VNKVLAGLRITPRFVFAVCLPGVQTNSAGLSQGKQGANMADRRREASLPEFSRAGIMNLLVSSRFFVALGLQEAIKAEDGRQADGLRTCNPTAHNERGAEATGGPDFGSDPCSRVHSQH
jgi:hypothetical protein